MEENRQEGQPTSPQDLLKRLGENKRSLHIARIPPKTRESFERLAHEEFCDDFGMTLKWLMDGTLSVDNEVLLSKLEEHEARISNIENVLTPKKEVMSEEEKPVQRRMLNGALRTVKA